MLAISKTVKRDVYFIELRTNVLVSPCQQALSGAVASDLTSLPAIVFARQCDSGCE